MQLQWMGRSFSSLWSKRWSRQQRQRNQWRRLRLTEIRPVLPDRVTGIAVQWGHPGVDMIVEPRQPATPGTRTASGGFPVLSRTRAAHSPSSRGPSRMHLAQEGCLPRTYWSGGWRMATCWNRSAILRRCAATWSCRCGCFTTTRWKAGLRDALWTRPGTMRIRHGWLRCATMARSWSESTARVLGELRVTDVLHRSCFSTSRTSRVDQGLYTIKLGTSKSLLFT
mmetsp:Transcript_79009/g.144044  ORF Transcript_79009/g.144044 Transcript_79009/m.144044 type:complete len:225 (-) Transcript_79009:3-677(-)